MIRDMCWLIERKKEEKEREGEGWLSVFLLVENIELEGTFRHVRLKSSFHS